MDTVIEKDEILGTITFLNTLGDIQIAWDERNKEKVLEMIRKKMKEGYTFFTTKKYLFGKVKRKSQITTRDINRGSIEDIIISDEEFEKMCEQMADADVAELVSNNNAELIRSKNKRDITAMTRAKSAEEVIASDSVAIKPVRGG